MRPIAFSSLCVLLVIALPASATTLFGIMASPGSPVALIEIDVSSGVGSSYSTPPASHNASLTRAGQLLYTTSQETLYSYNLATSSWSTIGTLDVADFDLTTPNALAYDNQTHTLYGTSGSTIVLGDSYLITINPLTATVLSSTEIAVGDVNEQSIEAMEFDPLTGVLWARASTKARLVTINPATGEATPGASLSDVESIGFVGSQMYGTRNPPFNDSVEWLRIDKFTGDVEVIGEVGFAQVNGLTSIPQPSTALLLAFGLTGLAVARRIRDGL